MTTPTRRTWMIGAAAMSALAVVQRGAGLLTMMLLARLVDTRGLGAYAFTQSTNQTFYGLARLGADVGLHVSLAAVNLKTDKARAEQLLGESLAVFSAMAVCVAFAIMALADPIADRLFGSPGLTPFVYAAAALFAAQAMSQYAYAAFAGLNAFAAYSRASAISVVVTTVAVPLGAYFGGALGAVWTLVAAQAGSVALMSITLSQVMKAAGLALRPRWPGGAAGTILKLGLPLYAGGLLAVPVEFANLGFLSRSAGIEALGDLRVTQALMSVATAIPTAIAGPSMTLLTEHYAANRRSAALLLQLKAIWIFGIAVAIVLATLWPHAIDLVFGTGFESARKVGALAIISFLATLLFTVAQGGLLARQAPGAFFWIGAAQAGLLALLGWLLIERYGLGGLLLAHGMAMVIVFGLVWLVLRRHDPSLRSVAWMGWLVAASATLFVLLACDAYWQFAATWRLLAGVVFAAAFVTAAVTRVFDAGERLNLAAAVSAGVKALSARMRGR
ncbi:MAG: hypothetical protein Q8R69_25630 [Telluria sp.]|nr:hypothetical protein [Telluria sp.]